MKSVTCDACGSVAPLEMGELPSSWVRIEGERWAMDPRSYEACSLACAVEVLAERAHPDSRAEILFAAEVVRRGSLLAIVHDGKPCEQRTVWLRPMPPTQPVVQP